MAIIRKVKSLFLPFAFWALVMGTVGIMLHSPADLTISKMLKDTFLYNDPASQPLWFLYTLFLTEICYIPISKLSYQWKVAVCVCCVICGIGLLVSGIKLPLRFDLVIAAMGYLLVGCITKRYFLANRMSKWVNFSVLFFASIAYSIIVLMMPRYDMYCSTGLWFSPIVAIVGSFGIMELFRKISSFLPNKIYNFLSYMALNAVIILTFHSKIFWGINKVVGNYDYYNHGFFHLIITILVETIVLYNLAFVCNKYFSIIVGKCKK